MQVELPYQLADILVEVRAALLHLRPHQIPLRTGHAHLSAPLSPVQDGQGDTDAHRLLVERMAVGGREILRRLRQTETEIQVGFQAGVGLGLRHVAFRL